MLILTANTKNKLKFFLEDRDPKEWGVQIQRGAGNSFHLSLVSLKPAPLEKMIEVEGYRFIFEPELEEVLKGATVDYLDTTWSSGFKIELAEAPLPKPSTRKLDSSLPAVQKIKRVIEDEINPALEGHGGFVELVGYEEDNAYVKLGGGCQGCSSSMATLKMGIERRLKEEVPELKEVIDQTDHASGASPYFL